MNNTLRIITVLFFASTYNVYAETKSSNEQAPEILSVTPKTVKMRHAQDIRIEIKNWQQDTQISITPGGAYIKNTKPTQLNYFSDSDSEFYSNHQLINDLSYQSSDKVHEAISSGSLIFLANGNTGLTILSKNDNSFKWIGSYNKLGNITQIASQDNQVIVCDDQGVLSLFDVTRPDAPLLISDFHLHGRISDLRFKNNVAHVIQNNNHIEIDFNSHSTPIISTQGVNQGGSRRSFIKDNILYVADWFSGMHLYDISLPQNPKLLSSYHTPGSPKGVVVRNNTAYIADDDHGLQIVDVSDPKNPSFISEIPLTGLAYTMKLIKDHLYIASHRGGFHIVDVSNDKQPKLISTFDTPSKAWALEYQSGLLYVADDSSGLLIFDVKNPAAPKLINQFNPGGFAEDVILKNNKAYIAFFDIGLIMLDISDPLNLIILSQLKTPGNARGIEIKNNLLYLASWEAGVLIIDIANETQPKILGHYDTKGATWGLSVEKNNLYAMDWWGGIKVLDVSNPKQPTFIGQYQTQDKIKDIVFHKDFIFTAHGSRGLQVYDANNSLNPVWATGLDFDGDAKAISVHTTNQNSSINHSPFKTLALVAAGHGGLVIADVSNPFQIKLLSQISTPTSADLVQVIDKMVFVATYEGDLFSIDISDPQHPQLTNQYSSTTQSIKSVGNSLHQLNENKTIKTYIVNKLTKDAASEQFPVNFKADIMASSDQSLFLASIDGQINRYSFANKTLKVSAKINLPEQLISLYLHQQKLYATTQSNKLYVMNINNKNNIELQGIYPTTHKIERISASNNGIFFSGESIIASAKLLPDIKIEHSNAAFIAKIPKNMPLGAYNLTISTPDGQQKTHINAFEITFPKLKSKFSMEDFKQKMKQKNLPGKANTQL